MSARVRRRRGLLLLLLALACGALTASQVRDHQAAVERRIGPLVPVAVAARDLAANAPVTRRDVRERRVPAAYLPQGALAPTAIATRDRTAVAIQAGSYLSAGLLRGSQAERGRQLLRPGQRALELAVTGGRELAGDAAPGSRVDVLVSTEPREGGGRTFVALESAELLALRAAGAEHSGLAEGAVEGSEVRSEATAVATLRVTLKQAVYLSAAENFAREVRLLPRPAGDRRRAGRAAVSADGL